MNNATATLLATALCLLALAHLLLCYGIASLKTPKAISTLLKTLQKLAPRRR